MGSRKVKKRARAEDPPSHRGAARLVVGMLLGMLLVAVLLVGLRHAQVPPLNERGLRVSGDGRNDATQVLDPGQFRVRAVRDAYAIAQSIPEILNQLYCWCGCIDGGLHRSALECFESRHGGDCTICVGTARTAWAMIQNGASDPAEIQRELDRQYSPFGV